MVLADIKNVNIIISEAYREDGDFLDNLWMDICNSNPDFELAQTFKALIIVLRFLIDNNIAKLIGYDDEKKKKISWDGEGEDELKNLESYLAQFTEEKIKKKPAFLDQFKYMSFQWKIPYPIDLKKYGI